MFFNEKLCAELMIYVYGALTSQKWSLLKTFIFLGDKR